MTDHDATRRPETRALVDCDADAVARELDRLRVDYLQFTFSREDYGWHGMCWVARRSDRVGHRVHTVVTTDLRELRAALDGDPNKPRTDRLTREQALRALL